MVTLDPLVVLVTVFPLTLVMEAVARLPPLSIENVMVGLVPDAVITDLICDNVKAVVVQNIVTSSEAPG